VKGERENLEKGKRMYSRSWCKLILGEITFSSPTEKEGSRANGIPRKVYVAYTRKNGFA